MWTGASFPFLGLITCWLGWMVQEGERMRQNGGQNEKKMRENEEKHAKGNLACLTIGNSNMHPPHTHIQLASAILYTFWQGLGTRSMGKSPPDL